MDYYSLFLGPGVISTIDEPQGALTSRSSTLTVLADSGPFRGLLLTDLGPIVISTINEPQGALTCRSSTPQFRPILARFFDYYSPFSGNEAIPIVVEPQGPLACRSSTLAVLSNCGPFHGLLLIVLGSSSGFHG